MHRNVFLPLLSIVHKSHCLLFINHLGELKSINVFLPLENFKLWQSSWNFSTNGVYFILPSSNPNMKCYEKCFCGNQIFLVITISAIPLVLTHLANYWNLWMWLLFNRCVVRIMFICRSTTCFKMMCSLCLKLTRAITSSWF